MKKLRGALALITAVVLAASLLCSCTHLKKFNYDEDGILTGSGAGNGYRYAPLGYEPVSVGSEYALIDNEMQEVLYLIGDEDPTQWLTTEYVGSATMVYYSTDIELPDLRKMAPEKVLFCDRGDTPNCFYTIGEADGEKALVEKLVELLSDGEANEGIWPRSDINESYSLKFYSPDWTAIYYNVTYADCAGGNFIYDRVTGRCVNVGDILEKYYENTYDESADGAV